MESNEHDQETSLNEIELTVPAGHSDHTRLDKYITQFVQNATRNKVQEGIKDGLVLVNGKPEKPSYNMQPGDVIHITLPKPRPPEARAESLDLDIVFEDEDLIIVNKPSGMVVHPAFGNWTGTLVNGLLHHAEQLSELNDPDIRPGIVHRIDKDTSGLLVVAKNDNAHSRLASQFAQHSIQRTYWAIVWGTPPESGTFSANIGRSKKDRKIMTIVDPEEGKRAITHFKVIQYFDHLALIEVSLETGRTHQIRVHFANNGFPVLGDRIYGGDSVRFGPNNGARKTMFENIFQHLNRQCLHAKTLGFKHPRTEESVLFDSPLPGDFRDTLNKLETYCKP